MPETVRLCSEFDPLHNVVCDLPLKHRGPHHTSVTWGDEQVAFFEESKGIGSEAPWDMSHD